MKIKKIQKKMKLENIKSLHWRQKKSIQGGATHFGEFFDGRENKWTGDIFRRCFTKFLCEKMDGHKNKNCVLIQKQNCFIFSFLDDDDEDEEDEEISEEEENEDAVFLVGTKCSSR